MNILYLYENDVYEDGTLFFQSENVLMNIIFQYFYILFVTKFKLFCIRLDAILKSYILSLNLLCPRYIYLGPWKTYVLHKNRDSDFFLGSF